MVAKYHKIASTSKRVTHAKKKSSRGENWRTTPLLPVGESSLPSTPQTSIPSPKSQRGYHDDNMPYVEPLQKPKHTSQNDYLRDFLPKRMAYLNAIISREQILLPRECGFCSTGEGLWRCEDCLGSRLSCTLCFRAAHKSLPFHRVEFWNGRNLEPAWLFQAGVEIYLGHQGATCPNLQCSNNSSDGDEGGGGTNDLGGGSDMDDSDLDQDQDFSNCHGGLPYLLGWNSVVIVDRSGVHRMKLNYCQCKDASSPELQCLAMGLFPSSFKTIKSLFTFQVLDDFRRDNLEFNASAMSYYNKLKSMTCKPFPHTVPDRYRELLRVSRIWRNLKHLKWRGFGQGEARSPNSGELTLFCAACPQPNVNLDPGWEQEEEKWKYTRGYVFDGNFKAESLKMKNPEDDVWLSDGHGFMVTDRPYKEHLKVAQDSKEARTCHTYNAIDRANMTRGHLVATGIGAGACARHGCFVPHCVVDFQLGERQMNMDYCVSECLKYKMNGIRRALLLYDIICQYWRNLARRFARNPHLSLPENMEIVRGIGLFHVHGHQDSCYGRFAPTFIHGAGQVDGEILETLWSVLNAISKSVRTMSAAGRQETLDDHMCESNWKKIVGQAKRIRKKYPKALQEEIESNFAFEELNKSASTADVERWRREEKAAQMARDYDEASMDIYDIQINRGPSKAEMQLHLLANKDKNGFPGSATLIAEGIKLEESQIKLGTLVSSLGRDPTVDERLDIAVKRERLQIRIDVFNKKASKIWPPSMDGFHVDQMPTCTSLLGSLFSEDEDGAWGEASPLSEPGAAEDSTILLPSAIGYDECAALGYHQLTEEESELRSGQLNDALQGIRMALSRKAVVFREGIRDSESKLRRGRSWDEIYALDGNLKHHAAVYKKGRFKLIHDLKAPPAVVRKYQELQREDLKIKTAVIDPQARGLRHEGLPWFWVLDVEGDINSSKGIQEFYRVHWLKASARKARAREERLLLEAEMGWVINYYNYRASKWENKNTDGSSSAGVQMSGRENYAKGQTQMWNQLAAYARAEFSQLKMSHES